jgi:uncharacterized protein YdcH (DUF465 family)
MACPALCANADCRGPDPGVSLRYAVLEDALTNEAQKQDTQKQDLLAELTAEHRRLDEQLQQLEKRRALTPSERDEISRLKKQKLLTKDRIARLSS